MKSASWQWTQSVAWDFLCPNITRHFLSLLSLTACLGLFSNPSHLLPTPDWTRAHVCLRVHWRSAFLLHDYPKWQLLITTDVSITLITALICQMSAALSEGGNSTLELHNTQTHTVRLENHWVGFLCLFALHREAVQAQVLHWGLHTWRQRRCAEVHVWRRKQTHEIQLGEDYWQQSAARLLSAG